MSSRNLLRCVMLAGLLIPMACGQLAQADEESSRDGVFLHISHGVNNPQRVLMALHMAELMAESRDVLVYFDIKGIEVVVKDAAGREVLRSGALDAQGNIAPRSVVYRTVVHDAKGRDTTLFWNTVKKVSDRRVPPLGSLTERFTVPVAKLGKRFTASVRLRYRSVSPRGLAEAGVPAGLIKPPIFTISQATRTFDVNTLKQGASAK